MTWPGRGPTCSSKRLACLPVKSEEVLHESLPPVRNDILGNPRPIGKYRSGDDRVALSIEGQSPFSLRDKFDSEIGEARAMNLIIGRAMFTATRDNGKQGVLGRVQIDMKSARLGDLKREEIWLVRWAVGHVFPCNPSMWAGQ